MKFFFSILLITFYFATTAQLPSYVPTNGLVGYWPFNGNANDESGNGNNGTVNGATLITDRFGNVNKAYNFNGLNQFIDIGNAGLGISQMPSNFSISIWVKSISGYGAILSRRHIENQNWQTLSMNGPYNAIFWLTDAPGYGQSPIQWSAIPLNTWIHIYVYKSGNNYGLYINSALISTWQDSYSFSNAFSNMHIGHQGAWNSFFNGSLDDLAIYNRALTQTEITQLYTSTTTPTTPEDTTSNVGIGTANPKRKLHINDVMRLEPRNTAPVNPGEGDIYYDAILKKLRYYNGTNWISL